MNRIIHFEIPVKEPDKTVEFYRNVFGWNIVKWDGPQDYWLINTGEPGTPGIDGAMYKPTELINGTINTIGVSNFEEYAEKIIDNGGVLLTEKMTIPGVGYMAYCRDIEGTTFGIIQEDPEAKVSF